MKKRITSLFNQLQKGEFPIFSDTKASEIIEDIICSSSSPSIDCEFCNRTWFDSTGENMDAGELRRFLLKQKRNPNKYRDMDSQVHWGYFDGRQVVINCDCNTLKVIEDFLWSNKGPICQYLKERADKLFDQSQHTKTSTDRASSAVAKV